MSKLDDVEYVLITDRGDSTYAYDAEGVESWIELYESKGRSTVYVFRKERTWSRSSRTSTPPSSS